MTTDNAAGISDAADSREQLPQMISAIEEALRMAAVNPDDCRTSGGDTQWNLKSHDIEIWIDIYSAEEEGRLYFQVMSPLVMVPENDKEAFFRHLLELNYQLIGTHFVVYKEGVYLKYMRDALNISTEEVYNVLNRFSRFAHVFQKGFATKFGATSLVLATK